VLSNCFQRLSNAVIVSLQDDSPNVRLEALTWLGNIVKGSNDGATFFDKVKSSLTDTAPSVRKAAIKIIFEAFVAAPDSPKASEACQLLVQLASDSQDHNSELVVTFIRELWFPSQGNSRLSLTSTVRNFSNWGNS
jgi:hypothetical protein